MRYYYNRYWGIFYSNPSLTEDTSSIFDEQSILIGPGYSGHFPHINSPGAQNLKNLGPIPTGFYTLEGPVSKKLSGETVGPSSWHLIPDPNTKMYGRSGFMIHGDTEAEAHDASDGCIISPYWVRVKFLSSDLLKVL